MSFIVGCKKGKHPDYQVWGAQSNCMKKMKKCSSFKEWINEFESVFNEGLYDRLQHIDEIIDNIPALQNEKPRRDLIKDLIKLHLNKMKIAKTVEDVKNKIASEKEFKDKIEKLPIDTKVPFMKFLKDGHVGDFMDSLAKREI